MTRILNANETAEHFGRSKNNTLKMLHAGQIPAIRMDKRWMVDHDILDEWLASESARQAEERKQQHR